MKKVVSIFTLFAFCYLAPAQKQKIEFIEYDLDNGLHVILHQDNSLPIVAVNLMYHVGSKNEDPQRTGFAHFFEHLMFEGSENIERGEYDTYINNAGGRLNAYTSFDETNYYEVLPSNQLELALWMESERLLHLKIDSAGIETQRKVVKEERKQRYENQPYGSWLADMFRISFTETPYSWTPIGEAQYIDMATYDEFMDFYKIYYVPNNVTLAVAGDIDIEAAKTMIADYFSAIPKGTQEMYRPKTVTVEKKEPVKETVYDNIQLPAVFKAYYVPEINHPDYYAIEMLQTLLSDGESSRLYKRLIDQEQKSVQVAAFPYILEKNGLFITLSLANMGIELSVIETIMDEEIKKVQETTISEREFKKLQNKIENDQVNTRASLGNLSSELCWYHIFKGNTDLINSQLDKYNAVTKEDIQRVAKTYLTEDNSVTLYYLPKPQETAQNH